MKNNLKKFSIVFLVIVIAFVGFFIYLQSNHKENAKYSRGYAFVPEKVSQSGEIKVHLPKGVDKRTAKKNITFDPQIEGEWLDQEKQAFLNFEVFASENEKDFIVFKPKDKLVLNNYYSLKLNLGEDKVMEAFFQAVEDPKIINIFPSEGTEAADDSKITMVFNRPIVPLTTLEELEKRNIPIEIFPKTEGKFKWISTNTLQFIPKKRLQRSSNYTVKINQGFTSMDGLKIEGKESHFTSKKLRYLGDVSKIDNVIYNQPIRIYFNQPVDLKKTMQEISLFKGDKQVDFIANYKGEKQKLGAGLFSSLFNSVNQEKEEIDKSVLEIYNKKDCFNRESLWDFSENYKIIINKAYPFEGDINIDNQREIAFRTTSIVKNWSAISERTSHTRTDLFDPKGKLLIDFYEPINLQKSIIEASFPIKNITYGQKCTDKNLSLSDVSCQKTDDKEKIILEFNASRINVGDTINVVLKKIINEEDFKINAEDIQKKLHIYNPLKVNIYNKDLTSIVVCSNNPLLQPEKQDFKKKIKADLDYEVFDWRKSYLYNWGECKGETPFRTVISVGLMPEKSYAFDFKIEDVFGGKQDLKKKIRTIKMESHYVTAFPMQQNYSITPPSDTKLNFATKNITHIDVSVCKMDGFSFIDNLNKRYNKNFDKNLCSTIKTKTIMLPERYWINNYFNINIKDFYNETLGNYAVLLNHPALDKYTSVNFVTVTNMAVGEKRITPSSYSNSMEAELTEDQLNALKNIYLVSDINNGKAVSQAEVYYYGADGYKKVGETDNNGVALVSPVHGLKGVVIKKGLDSTIIKGYESSLKSASRAYNIKRFFIYQDKPIYRPGEKVNLKAILRLGYDGNYKMLENEKVDLRVINSKGDDVFKKSLALDDFGTVNTDFILDSEAALGSYAVCIMNNCSYFDVQEYVPAAFEVKLNTQKEEYISKDKVKINIDANYYFGVPVENAKVEYTVSSQNYYFDKYKEEYFRFGSFDWDSYYGDKFLLRGETFLDNDGKGVIEEVMDLENFHNSKIIVVEATVKNAMGQSVSAQKSFIVHAGEFYLGVNTDPYFQGKNQEFSLKVKSVNTEGEALMVKNIKAEIFKVEWVYAKRQEIGGSYSYKWEKKKELVQDFNFNTNSKGDYLKKLKLNEEGAYEIKVSSEDHRGNIVSSMDSIYIYGEGAVSVRQNNKTDLNLIVKKDKLNPGEKGEIVIESPYKKAKALIAIERGKVFEYEVVDISGNLFNYTFDIKEAYYPNVFISVLLQSKEDPSVKFGSKEFKISSDVKKINIDLKSDRDFYEPGDEVKLKIKTKDYKNQAVSSNVSIAVVDLSVLALKGNPKKDPLVFFYDGFPLAVSTFSNLKNIIKRQDLPSHTKGGGGSDEKDEKARGEFKDTALFKANVFTDKNGEAEIIFKLPDNLTTWQTEAVGVTKDTKLGVSYINFMSKKDLMVVPLKPRFIIPGDEFYIGAQIFNQSNTFHNFNINFKSSSLELLEKSKKKIKIGAEDSKRVYFKVKAPENITEGYHSFEILAEGGGLSDGVFQAIKIKTDLTYEATATAGYNNNNFAFETIYIPENISSDLGDLTIKSSATLAVFLSDSLNYLLQYPYGCAEQISSRLKAMAIIKKGLDIPNLSDKFNLEKIIYNDREYTLDEVMQIGLSKIYSYQNYDGGFSFWGNGYSSYYLTISIVDALNYMKEAGYNVSENILKKGANYLYREYNRNSQYQTVSNTIMLAKTLGEVEDYKNNSVLRSKIVQITKDEGLLKDKLNNKFLAELAVIVNSGDYDSLIRKRVNNFLDNKINIDARGAFLDAPSDYAYYYFETAISNTATYLNSVALAKRETSFNDKVVRWLLNSRDKNGVWGSTQNTLKVVEAFTNYLKWKEETKTNYNLEIDLNNKQVESFNFNKETILDQIHKVVPISELKKGDFNFLEFKKDNKGGFYYDLGLKYYLKGGNVSPRDEGFTITRGFYQLEDEKNESPLNSINTGDVFKAHIEIVVPKTRRFVAIEDYIPAGLEIINMDLQTEQSSLRFTEKEITNRLLYPDFKEIRDDRYFIYKDYLTPGVYEFDYYVRALVKGKYLKLPSVVSEMYTPENFGRTQSEEFEVK